MFLSLSSPLKINKQTNKLFFNGLKKACELCSLNPLYTIFYLLELLLHEKYIQVSQIDVYKHL